MPRYFFNVQNGQRGATDHVGTELADNRAARLEAIRSLAEIARDELPRDGDRTNMSIHVTRDEGRPLFVVRLDFEVEFIEPSETVG